jgi:transposase InsO family protein
MLRAAASLPFHRELHRFSTSGHPEALDACYVASCQLPRPDFHRLVDDDFQDTPPAASAGVRTIKEEEVDLSEYNDFNDARSQIGRFLEDVYMTKRIHLSLGYLTPLEFETAWRLAHPVQTTP